MSSSPGTPPKPLRDPISPPERNPPSNPMHEPPGRPHVRTSTTGKIIPGVCVDFEAPVLKWRGASQTSPYPAGDEREWQEDRADGRHPPSLQEGL
jgi:hypothetical protein